MKLLTTREVGELLGVAEWRVRRVFEAKLLPEPPRFGGKRLIEPALIPLVVDAMQTRGWAATPIRNNPLVKDPQP